MICTLTNYEESNERCQRCEWSPDCKEDKPVPVQYQGRIEYAADLWRQGKEQEQIAADKLATAKGIITNIIKETGINTIRVSMLSISLKEQQRKTYNIDTLIPHIPPYLLEQATKITKFNVLRIRDLLK
jgi:hypothetical protein